jgi:phage host-nuclease inhibitor protein Gam
MAKARVRLESPALQSWADVDKALREIGQEMAKVEAMEAEYNEAVGQLKEQLTEQVRPHQENRQRLERLVKEFVEEHKAELVGKSRELNFGRVGFRLSTSIVVKNAKAVLSLLKSKRLFGCIAVKETVSKDELKKLDEATLAELGVSRKTEDVFWYEVKRDEVREV